MEHNVKSDYERTLEELYAMMPDFQQVGAGAYKPGLERVEAFDRHLGNPSRDFSAIHVAGTNGKGSVSHMLASILTASGYRTGLYTSPHLFDFRERIRVDGEMIPESEVVGFAERNMEKMRELRLSFFEATVGMAFEWFSDSGVEVAVIETGLGGRLDATNIIKPEISIITNIGLEHTSFLGDTLAAIAGEKAGIIKAGVPVVIGERGAETDPVFEQAAAGKGSRIFFAEDIFTAKKVHEEQGLVEYRITTPKQAVYHFRLDMAGDYQRHNLLTVLGTIHVLNRHTRIGASDRAVKEGLASTALNTGIAGRWHTLVQAPLIVCDTGHNAHGLREVVAQIDRQSFDKLYMVLGVADDKDLAAILPLLPGGAHYIFTQASVRRAMPAVELEAAAAAYGLRGEMASDVPAAVKRARSLAAPGDMIFIGGSSFVVADIPRDMFDSEDE